MDLHRKISSFATLLVVAITTLAFAGCQRHGMVSKRTSAQVGTHLIKVDRHVFHLSNTDYKKGDNFYKYSESGPIENFEFTFTDERVAISGHELGMVKPNDELLINDDGVTVKRSDTNQWLDGGQTKTYLADNAKQVTAQK